MKTWCFYIWHKFNRVSKELSEERKLKDLLSNGIKQENKKMQQKDQQEELKEKKEGLNVWKPQDFSQR